MSRQRDEQGNLISKTQMKKRMSALQALGESLIELPAKQYNDLPLPETLRDAVDIARGMSKRGALHRQKQFIGRVMRNIDPAPIRSALERLAQADRRAARRFHRVETLRDQLLADDRAVYQLRDDFPSVDETKLQEKVQAARRQAASERSAASRALFRFLDELLRDDGAG